MDDTTEKLLENDKKRVRRVLSGGGSLSDLSLAGVLQNVFWVGAICSMGFMVLSMPWVGPDAPIPGAVWLAASIVGMALCSTLALVVRAIEANVEAQMDVPRGRSRGGR